MLTADCDEATWRRILDVNLTGTLALHEPRDPRGCSARGGGAMSTPPLGAGPDRQPELPSAYIASKHGILGLTKAARHRVRLGKGIRVNAVCPGPGSEDGAGWTATFAPGLKEKVVAAHPLGLPPHRCRGGGGGRSPAAPRTPRRA